MNTIAYIGTPLDFEKLARIAAGLGPGNGEAVQVVCLDIKEPLEALHLMQGYRFAMVVVSAECVDHPNLKEILWHTNARLV